jgi:hypothetical protein
MIRRAGRGRVPPNAIQEGRAQGWLDGFHEASWVVYRAARRADNEEERVGLRKAAEILHEYARANKPEVRFMPSQMIPSDRRK